jgi:hypothetical protein
LLDAKLQGLKIKIKKKPTLKKSPKKYKLSKLGTKLLSKRKNYKTLVSTFLSY